MPSARVMLALVMAFSLRYLRLEPKEREGIMTFSRKILAVAAGLVVALQAPQSIAAPVTISTGQSAIFNFDYTGYTPAPPYFNSMTEWTLSGVFNDGETDAGTIRFFDGLNGTGAQSLTDYEWSDLMYNSGIGTLDLMFTDGLFSIVFTPTIGNVTIQSFSNVYMRTEAGGYIYYERDPSVVIVGGNNVPEPAGILLVATSLLALTAMRRKANHTR